MPCSSRLFFHGHFIREVTYFLIFLVAGGTLEAISCTRRSFQNAQQAEVSAANLSGRDKPSLASRTYKRTIWVSK